MTDSIDNYPSGFQAVRGLVQNNDLQVVDGDERVYMVHFDDKDRHNSTLTSYRGDVYNHDHKCVCASTGLIEEMDWEVGILPSMQPIPTPNSIYSVPPGTILRLFFAHDRWYLCTNRQLNAFRYRPFYQGQTVPSYGLLFVNMLLDDCPANWITHLNVSPDQQYTFLLVSEDYVAPDQHGVFLLSITRSGEKPNLAFQSNLSEPLSGIHLRIRSPVPVDFATVHTTEPEFGYLIQSSDKWIRLTSAHYRSIMSLLDNCADPRRRYMQLEATDPEKLQAYLMLRPSVADLKLQDDYEWSTVVSRLLNDHIFRRNLIRHPKAYMRWTDLANEWNQQSNPIQIRIQALMWWYRERHCPHFRTST